MQANGLHRGRLRSRPSSMCANGTALPDPLFLASRASPFAPGCDGVAATGALYENAEVEPMIAVNPTNPANLVGVWQQDRWSDGGSHALMTGYSSDGGRTWARTAAPLSRCAGGNARQRRRLRSRERPVGHVCARRHRIPDLDLIHRAGRPAGLRQRRPGQPLHEWRHLLERPDHVDPRQARGLQ